MCVTATAAYSQDCNSYLKQAAELVSQKNYCDALSLYRKYRDCNADADVSTEIAMCERRCKLDGGNPEIDNTTQQGNTTSEGSRTVKNTTSSSKSAVKSAPSVSSSAKFKLGLNGGLLYPMEKEEGAKTYLFFGGGISGEYLVKPNIGVGLSAGYYGYQLTKVDGEKETVSIMPVALTGRYYFLTKSIQPYAGVDVGLYTLGDKVTYQGESKSGSKSYFGLAPVVGLQFKLSNTLALDVNTRYNLVFIEGDTGYNIGFNVGVVYAFGK